MCEMACQIIQKKKEEKRIEEEQAAKAYNSKIPACCDDDDDYNFAITPNEPIDSLSMGEEHLDTISATESDEFIKSCVENLVPNPKEIDSFFNPNDPMPPDIEEDNGDSERDILILEELPSNYSLSLPENESFHFDILSFSRPPAKPPDADTNPTLVTISHVPMKTFWRKSFRTLFKEEIIPMKIDHHHFNAESDLIESMLNHDSSSITSSSKLDSLLDEFTEEIDSFFNPDDPMPPDIEEDDGDSERDILILKELPSNYSLSLPENESFHFDILSFSRPPAKPPDGNTGILNIKIMGDNSEQKEKSPDLSSHQGFEAFQPSAECPMMINRKNTPLLDVPLFHFYPP
nr:hypothetical protein [Tanacetum cinerariifolium]